MFVGILQDALMLSELVILHFTLPEVEQREHMQTACAIVFGFVLIVLGMCVDALGVCCVSFGTLWLLWERV